MHTLDVTAQGNIVGDLVQFAAHRDLIHVLTRVRHQRLAIIGRDHGIAYHEAFVEKGLQSRYRCARGHSMRGGVSRMLRATLGITVRQQVGAAPAEDLADCLRVQHVSMEWVLCGMGERVVNKAPVRFWA